MRKTVSLRDRRGPQRTCSLSANVATSQLRQAVEGLHSCRATLREVAFVREECQGQAVWEGDVRVFDLEGHPTATAAYAWSDPVPGSDRRRFYAVLHEGPIQSPADAVRASIVQSYREEHGTT